ncbi:MAG: DUF2066 domain-containing protein [Endozoicomonas sp.]
MNLLTLVVLKLCLLALCPQTLLASQVSSLYRVEVPVNSQAEVERQQAMNRGMAEVLVKVTGQRQVLSEPVVKTALRRATTYVRGFGYKREDTEEGRQLLLDVSFDETAVTRLLRENRLGIWGQNRPATLAWLAVDKGGRRSILRSGVNVGVQLEMNRMFELRALPLIFPLMDFEDEMSVSPVDIWGLFSDKLRSASQRYGSESVLGGRLTVSSSENGDRYSGRLVLMFRNQRYDAEITDLGSEGLSRAMADLVGNTLSRHYGVTSGIQSENPIMSVDGVLSTRDYARVVSYLEGLTAVRNVSVRKLSGARIELELSIDGTVSQLVDSIALERKLVRPSGDSNLPVNQLNYHWRGR